MAAASKRAARKRRQQHGDGKVQLYAQMTEAATAATAMAASLRATRRRLIFDRKRHGAACGPTALVRGGVDPAADLHRHQRYGLAKREPTSVGGWYVSADPSARTAFESRYQATFTGESPTRPGKPAMMQWRAGRLLLPRWRAAQVHAAIASRTAKALPVRMGFFRFH